MTRIKIGNKGCTIPCTKGGVLEERFFDYLDLEIARGNNSFSVEDFSLKNGICKTLNNELRSLFNKLEAKVIVNLPLAKAKEPEIHRSGSCNRCGIHVDYVEYAVHWASGDGFHVRQGCPECGHYIRFRGKTIKERVLWGLLYS